MFNKVQLGTFPHVVASAYLTTAVFVLGISAWLYLRKQADAGMYRRAMRLGAWALALSGVVVIVTGDIQGKIMTEVQPMKMASAEALYNTESSAPFSILTIGTPDGKSEKFSIKVPKLLSFLATGTFGGKVEGINDLRAAYQAKYGTDPGAKYYSPSYTPVIPLTYWSFRWMMGLGAVGALLGFLVLWLTRRGRAPNARWFSRAAIAAPVFVLLANSVGWIFTEAGRQPWVVFGLMTTKNGISPGVSAFEVWTTIIGFTLVYGVLAVIEVRLLAHFVKQGADPFIEPPDPSRSDSDSDRPLTFAY
jgi:cytochrome d ubiquinol oxidase subunit I